MTSSLCGSSTRAHSLAKKPGTGAAPGAPGSADPSLILRPGRALVRRPRGRIPTGDRDATTGGARGPGLVGGRGEARAARSLALASRSRPARLAPPPAGACLLFCSQGSAARGPVTSPRAFKGTARQQRRTRCVPRERSGGRSRVPR